MPPYGLRLSILLRSVHRTLPVRHHLGDMFETVNGSKMSSQSEAQMAQVPSGQDEADITAKLKQLITPQSNSKVGWTLVLDGAGIQRSFKFKTFNKTWVCRDKYYIINL